MCSERGVGREVWYGVRKPDEHQVSALQQREMLASHRLTAFANGFSRREIVRHGEEQE